MVDSYTVALAGLVLPLGALGDRLGRRALLLLGAIVFGAAAFAAAESSGTTALILWRSVMGLGAAMMMPGTLATITAVYPPHLRDRAAAIWSGCAAAGSILGLLASGALLELFSWRSIFITAGLAAAATALATLVWVPESKETQAPRFDAAGSLCTALAPGALVYALIAGSEEGWSTPPVIAALAVAALAATGYVLIGLRTDKPLLDPRLFRIRAFSAGSVALTVQFMILFGFFFVGLQYLRLILDYAPLKAAVALAPVALVVIPVSLAAPVLIRWVGMRTVLVSGLALLGSGLVVLSMLTVTSGYLPFLGSILLAGFGIGLTGTAGTSAITGALTEE
ncbi:MFS transporter [Streptomyces sp. NPDC054837]